MEEHSEPTNKSEPAKHLKNNSHHVFNWVTLCKAPQNYKNRRIVRSYVYCVIKTNFKWTKDLEILTPLRNGVIWIPTSISC